MSELKQAHDWAAENKLLREENAALRGAGEAVLVAIDTNASRGGDLGFRIDRANPLSVKTLREALSRTIGGKP